MIDCSLDSEFSKPIQDYIKDHFPEATIEQWEHEKKESINFNVLENNNTYVVRVMEECLVGIEISEIRTVLENYGVAQVMRDLGGFPIVVTNTGCIFGSP